LFDHRVLTSPPLLLFQIYPTVGASSLAAVVKPSPTNKVLYRCLSAPHDPLKPHSQGKGAHTLVGVVKVFAHFVAHPVGPTDLLRYTLTCAAGVVVGQH